jgi:hypothetical protein
MSKSVFFSSAAEFFSLDLTESSAKNLHHWYISRQAGATLDFAAVSYGVLIID